MIIYKSKDLHKSYCRGRRQRANSATAVFLNKRFRARVLHPNTILRADISQANIYIEQLARPKDAVVSTASPMYAFLTTLRRVGTNFRIQEYRLMHRCSQIIQYKTTSSFRLCLMPSPDLRNTMSIFSAGATLAMAVTAIASVVLVFKEIVCLSSS